MAEQESNSARHDLQGEPPQIQGATPKSPRFPRQSWISMMLEPRQTLRAVLDSPSPSRYFWPILVLSVLMGILGALGDLPMEVERPMLVGLVIALPIAVLIAWGMTQLFGRLYRWVGSWFGGTGDPRSIVIGMIWSQIPTVLGLPLLLILVLIFGVEVLYEPDRITQGNWWQSTVAVLISLLQMIFAIWSLVLAVANLAEAHRFSLWRSVWTHAIVLIFVIVLLTLPMSYLANRGLL